MTALLPFCYPFGLRCCSNAALLEMLRVYSRDAELFAGNAALGLL
jgi:hypothetical protein